APAPPAVPSVTSVAPPLSKPTPRPALPQPAPVAAESRPDVRVPTEPPATPRRPATAAATSFDWENIVGVKLFSAVAGIALVLAAVFFLRYSMDHGWLAPPVRVAIGILVAIVLLIVCERKAARGYPATANALDAASIAILFSTFFSAHALWHLIPVTLTFGLLALVTGLAVLLSI